MEVKCGIAAVVVVADVVAVAAATDVNGNWASLA